MMVIMSISHHYRKPSSWTDCKLIIYPGIVTSISRTSSYFLLFTRSNSSLLTIAG